MASKKHKILNAKEIAQKVQRMAYSILENHYDSKFLYIAGIEPGGLELAKFLGKEILKIQNLEMEILGFKMDKSKPYTAHLDKDLDSGKHVLLVDDVANSGITLAHCTAKLLEYKPASVQIAVLVDRRHKRFPIHADYVGLSLATTLQEHIEAEMTTGKEVVWLV